MVIKLDKEGHTVLTELVDTYLKTNGLKGKAIVDAVIRGIEILPEATVLTKELNLTKENKNEDKTVNKK